MNKETIWGNWQTLAEHKDNESITAKIKVLVVKPEQSLSFQRHQHRKEVWLVAKGQGTLRVGRGTEAQEQYDKILDLYRHRVIEIPVGTWHLLTNTLDEDLIIYELQAGDYCSEDDIERKPAKY